MRQTLIGTIISDKQNQTAVVEIVSWGRSRIFGKRFKKKRRLQAHNPNNKYQLGIVVTLQESRPISRHKHWVIIGEVKGKE